MLSGEESMGMTMMNKEARNESQSGESKSEDKEVPPEQRENSSKNGRQKGADNVERLLKYLKRLKEADTRLPASGGKPDKSAIALACGFNRQTLYNNPAAIALLDEAVVDIGVEDETKVVDDGKAAHTEHQMGKRNRRIQQLEEMLHTRTAEVRGLKEKLREYELMEEVMSTSGRRFRP